MCHAMRQSQVFEVLTYLKGRNCVTDLRPPHNIGPYPSGMYRDGMCVLVKRDTRSTGGSQGLFAACPRYGSEHVFLRPKPDTPNTLDPKP